MMVNKKCPGCEKAWVAKIEELERQLAASKAREAAERKRAEKAEAELADIREATRKVLAERCPTDEKHCGCVPILRGENRRLREALQEFVTAQAAAQQSLAEERGKRFDKARECAGLRGKLAKIQESLIAAEHVGCRAAIGQIIGILSSDPPPAPPVESLRDIADRAKRNYPSQKMPVPGGFVPSPLPAPPVEPARPQQQFVEGQMVKTRHWGNGTITGVRWNEVLCEWQYTIIGTTAKRPPQPPVFSESLLKPLPPEAPKPHYSDEGLRELLRETFPVGNSLIHNLTEDLLRERAMTGLLGMGFTPQPDSSLVTLTVGREWVESTREICDFGNQSNFDCARELLLEALRSAQVGEGAKP